MTHDVDFAIEHMQELKNRILELQSEYDKVVSDLKRCRNELCLKCGEYKTAHLGSCDGCIWKDVG